MIPTHKDFHNRTYVWTYIRDALDGESAIKRENTKYLPMPSAMAALPPSPSLPSTVQQQSTFSHGTWDVPFAHSNKAYETYLQRARYPLIVPYTVRSLAALAVRKPPTFNVPKSLDYLEDILEDVYKRLVSATLSYGRVWLAVDIDAEGKFCLVIYRALSGIDWKENQFVVFKECIGDTGDEAKDYRYVRLSLGEGEEGAEGQRMYRVDEAPGDADNFDQSIPVWPSYQGKTLNKLPVVCCGSMDTNWEVDPIPVEGIASCALHIYMKDADLSQSEYMCCNPFLVFLNVDKKDVPTAIGSTIAIALPGDNVDAKYVEPTGSALTHMLNTIKTLYEEAADYGAQLLGASKTQVESGDALRIRQNASGASLLSVMQVVTNAINEALEYIAEWSGVSPDELNAAHEKDLAEIVLSPQELSALTQAWMSGAISYDSYFTRLQKGGVVAEDRTAEEERALIEQEAPGLVIEPDDSGDENDDDEGDGEENADDTE